MRRLCSSKGRIRGLWRRPQLRGPRLPHSQPSQLPTLASTDRLLPTRESTYYHFLRAHSGYTLWPTIHLALCSIASVVANPAIQPHQLTKTFRKPCVRMSCSSFCLRMPPPPKEPGHSLSESKSDLLPYANSYRTGISNAHLSSPLSTAFKAIHEICVDAVLGKFPLLFARGLVQIETDSLVHNTEIDGIPHSPEPTLSTATWCDHQRVV